MFDPIAVSFVVYTLAIVGLGLYSARFAKKTASDFFLAGRGLGAWVAALSSSASAESGWVTLGLVGMAYKTGIGATWIVLGTFLAFSFNWFVLAWRLRTTAEEYDALTLPDVLAAPYRGWPALLIRLAGVAIILSMLATYVAAQLSAAGKTFDSTFDLSYTQGVLIGAFIILVYTVTGGFRAIAWTDVVQASFMIVTVVVLPLVLISAIGGPGAFWEALETDSGNAHLTSAFAGKSGLVLIGFMALMLGVPLGNPGQPHVLVRLMAVKDRQAMMRAGVISSAWVVVLFTGAIVLGMAGRVYFGPHVEPDVVAKLSDEEAAQLAPTQIDPEKTLPTLARDSNIVPGFIGGMIIAAILAAICSTADSQLLVSASSVSHDLVVRVFKVKLTPRRQMIVDRSAVLLIGGVATALALGNTKAIFDFVLVYGWAGLGAGFGPALILSLFWRRTTGWGVLAGMVVGVTTAIVWTQVEMPVKIYNLVPAFAFSALTIMCVSLATQSDHGGMRNAE